MDIYFIGWLIDIILCVVGYPLIDLCCMCRVIPPCCFILCLWDMGVDFCSATLGWMYLVPDLVGGL